MTNQELNNNHYDTIEFQASKKHASQVVIFLKKKCDGLLSTGHAQCWAREIARIFPDSKLSMTIDSLEVKVLTKKQRRLLQKRANLANRQYEMLLSFTFNK